VPESLQSFTAEMDAYIRERGLAKSGEPVLFVAGHPIGLGGSTDSLAVHYLS